MPTCAVTAADVQGPFFQFSGVPNKGDWICQGKHRRWGPPEIDAEVVVITGRVLDEVCTTEGHPSRLVCILFGGRGAELLLVQRLNVPTFVWSTGKEY